MTFLNPLVLFGLLAAAIPILLHLLNLRKVRTIEFSTLSFLKELQKTKIRRIKIRQWLLLLLRTLFVIFLVTAFARPTLRGPLSGVVGERARTTAVLLLDDTPSMLAADEHGEYLQQAIDAALRVAALTGDGDEVYVLRLSELQEPGSSHVVQPLRNNALLRSMIGETKISFRHASLEDALRFSARLLATSTHLNKEVYVLSDFQEGGVTSEQSSSLAQEQLFPESVRFFAVNIGNQKPNNIGIESVSLPTTMFEVGKAFPVRVRLVNAGEHAVDGFIVSLFLNGERVTQKGVDIQRGSTVDVEFTAVPKSTGIIQGMVELESDDLDFDNRRYFTLEIPVSLRILLVGSPSDLQYLRLALETRSSGSAFQLHETTVDRLTSSAILASDVLVFSNPRDLTPAQREQVALFLSSGRGVVVFPGPQTQPAAFNSIFAEQFKAPRMLGLEQLRPDPARDELESFVTFDRVDLRHPLFQGMFEEDATQKPASRSTTQRTIESPHVKTFVRYQQLPQARSIVTLSNGAPFLLETTSNSGRLLLFSVAPNIEWSDFPRKGLFVPLVHRVVMYLAVEPPVGEALVGQEVVIRTRSRLTDRWSVVTPTKGETVVQPIASGMDRIIRYRENETPGIYALKSGATTVRTFAANIDRNESRTAKAEKSELERMYRRLGIVPGAVHTIEPSAEIQRAILQARLGVELWKQFLLAALVVAILEMLVARESKRELASLPPVTSLP